MALEKVLYTEKIHTTGGREGGSSRSDDGRLEVKISPPGSSGAGTNPEQLFGAGWSNCFLSALKLVSSKKKVPLPPETSVDAEVDLGMIGGGYVLAVRLHVKAPGIERSVAEAIIEEAHQTCPYSKATRGNIDVKTTFA
jgi:Ohr subfamily peroxiredoxin